MFDTHKCLAQIRASGRKLGAVAACVAWREPFGVVLLVTRSLVACLFPIICIGTLGACVFHHSVCSGCPLTHFAARTGVCVVSQLAPACHTPFCRYDVLGTTLKILILVVALPPSTLPSITPTMSCVAASLDLTLNPVMYRQSLPKWRQVILARCRYRRRSLL